MRGKAKIASAREVLEYLTQTMRAEDAKDAFRAAELLGKHFGLFAEARAEPEGVTIVDDISAAHETPQ